MIKCPISLLLLFFYLMNETAYAEPKSALVSCSRRSVLASSLGDIGSTTCSVAGFNSPGKSPRIYFGSNSCPGFVDVTIEGSSATISGSMSDAVDRCHVVLLAGDNDGPKSGSNLTFTAYGLSLAVQLRIPESATLFETVPLGVTATTRLSISGVSAPLPGASFACESATDQYGEEKTCEAVGASMGTSSGVLSWTPNTSSEGGWKFLISAKYPGAMKIYKTLKVYVRDMDPPPFVYLTLPQPGLRIPSLSKDISRWPVVGRCSTPGNKVIISGIVSAEATCRQDGTFSVNGNLTSFNGTGNPGNIALAVANASLEGNPAPLVVSHTNGKLTASYAWRNIFKSGYSAGAPAVATVPPAVLVEGDLAPKAGRTLSCEPAWSTSNLERNQLYFVTEWIGGSSNAVTTLKTLAAPSSRYTVQPADVGSQIGCRNTVAAAFSGNMLKNRDAVAPGSTQTPEATTLADLPGETQAKVTAATDTSKATVDGNGDLTEDEKGELKDAIDDAIEAIIQNPTPGVADDLVSILQDGVSGCAACDADDVGTVVDSVKKLSGIIKTDDDSEKVDDKIVAIEKIIGGLQHLPPEDPIVLIYPVGTSVAKMIDAVVVIAGQPATTTTTSSSTTSTTTTDGGSSTGGGSTTSSTTTTSSDGSSTTTTTTTTTTSSDGSSTTTTTTTETTTTTGDQTTSAVEAVAAVVSVVGETASSDDSGGGDSGGDSSPVEDKSADASDPCAYDKKCKNVCVLGECKLVCSPPPPEAIACEAAEVFEKVADAVTDAGESVGEVAAETKEEAATVLQAIIETSTVFTDPPPGAGDAVATALHSAFQSLADAGSGASMENVTKELEKMNAHADGILSNWDHLIQEDAPYLISEPYRLLAMAYQDLRDDAGPVLRDGMAMTSALLEDAREKTEACLSQIPQTTRCDPDPVKTAKSIVDAAIKYGDIVSDVYKEVSAALAEIDGERVAFMNMLSDVLDAAINDDQEKAMWEAVLAQSHRTGGNMIRAWHDTAEKIEAEYPELKDKLVATWHNILIAGEAIANDMVDGLLYYKETFPDTWFYTTLATLGDDEHKQMYSNWWEHWSDTAAEIDAMTLPQREAFAAMMEDGGEILVERMIAGYNYVKEKGPSWAEAVDEYMVDRDPGPAMVDKFNFVSKMAELGAACLQDHVDQQEANGQPVDPVTKCREYDELIKATILAGKVVGGVGAAALQMGSSISDYLTDVADGVCDFECRQNIMVNAREMAEEAIQDAGGALADAWKDSMDAAYDFYVYVKYGGLGTEWNNLVDAVSMTYDKAYPPELQKDHFDHWKGMVEAQEDHWGGIISDPEKHWGLFVDDVKKGLNPTGAANSGCDTSDPNGQATPGSPNYSADAAAACSEGTAGGDEGEGGGSSGPCLTKACFQRQLKKTANAVVKNYHEAIGSPEAVAAAEFGKDTVRTVVNATYVTYKVGAEALLCVEMTKEYAEQCLDTLNKSANEDLAEQRAVMMTDLNASLDKIGGMSADVALNFLSVIQTSQTQSDFAGVRTLSEASASSYSGVAEAVQNLISSVATSQSIDLDRASIFLASAASVASAASDPASTATEAERVRMTQDAAAIIEWAADHPGQDSADALALLLTAPNPSDIGDIFNATVNSAPVATAASSDTNEDTPLNGQLQASDAQNDEISLWEITSNVDIGSLQLNTSTGLWTYTPKANSHDQTSFSFRAYDGRLWSEPANVSITIDPVNDAPSSSATTVAATEDTTFSGTLPAATDIDSSVFTWSIVTNGTKGTATVTNAATGAFSYVPSLNANGSDTFTYRVCDNGTPSLCSSPYTATVTITPVNDAPASSPMSVSATEDTTFSGTFPAATDIDSTVFTWSIVGFGTKGTVTLTNAATGAFTYVPNSNVNGPDALTYKVCDNGTPVLCSPTYTAVVTIAAVNDAPTFTNPGAKNATENTLFSFNAGPGSDVDGDTLSFTCHLCPSGASITAAGVFSWTPGYGVASTANPNVSQSVTLRVSDGNGGTADQTFNISVANSDRPPTTADYSSTTAGAHFPSGVSAASLGSDPDGDAVSLEIITTYDETGAEFSRRVIIDNASPVVKCRRYISYYRHRKGTFRLTANGQASTTKSFDHRYSSFEEDKGHYGTPTASGMTNDDNGLNFTLTCSDTGATNATAAARMYYWIAGDNGEAAQGGYALLMRDGSDPGGYSMEDNYIVSNFNMGLSLDQVGNYSTRNDADVIGFRDIAADFPRQGSWGDNALVLNSSSPIKFDYWFVVTQSLGQYAYYSTYRPGYYNDGYQGFNYGFNFFRKCYGGYSNLPNRSWIPLHESSGGVGYAYDTTKWTCLGFNPR